MPFKTFQQIGSWRWDGSHLHYWWCNNL